MGPRSTRQKSGRSVGYVASNALEMREVRGEQGGERQGASGSPDADVDGGTDDRLLRPLQAYTHVPPGGELRISNDGDESHWTCPDCRVACFCVGAARAMLHAPCGRSPDVGEADDPDDPED